ncbi:hypothetical protein [Nitratireductor thuwali]|uniref:DUF995 domain-containing protein n=1 Tax=Nitratireductor thuwali TaxID=2267699 RepID=A0ABY5MKY7_9HYPH|nr:hypothetical protein NTH_03137 [Nitratireductor thuwali]
MAALENAVLAKIMAGTTHILRLGDKEAAIYYETSTIAHMLLPDGTARSGAWRLEDGGYSVDWENGPSARWFLDNYATGRIGYVDEKGERRAELVRIVFGNAESLPRRPG